MMKTPYQPAENRYDRMIYRKCGTWGLRLPVISLGAAFETVGGRMDDAASRETILTAFDLGITHLDLANNYGQPAGNAEIVVGKVLKELPRDEIIISTKAGFRMWPGPYGIGLSKKYLVASLDQSLKRLGQDYVDIFYAHAPDEETPIEETMAALDLMVRQGKALYIGVANFSAAEYEAAVACSKENGLAPITIHQTPYNILARGAEVNLFPNLQKHGAGCAVFYVLGQGVLSGKYLGGKIPPDTRVANLWTEADKRVGLAEEALKQIERLAEIAKARGQALAQMCIAWALRHPAVTTAVLGASRVSQVVENAKSIENLDFSDEEVRLIEEISPRPG
jgi:L-glyceraldehyde 3-phosphate reductase